MSTYLVLNDNWLSTPHWGGLRYHRFLKIRLSSRAILYYTPQNVCKGNIPGVLFSWETEFCLEWVVRKQKKISLARKCFGCKFSFKATVSEKDTQHKGDTMKCSCNSVGIITLDLFLFKIYKLSLFDLDIKWKATCDKNFTSNILISGSINNWTAQITGNKYRRKTIIMHCTCSNPHPLHYGPIRIEELH